MLAADGRQNGFLPGHSTEVHFASFFSGGFITAIVVNPSEKKLAKRTCALLVKIDQLKSL